MFNVNNEVETLAQIPFLQGLPTGKLKLLALTSEGVDFNEGEHLCHQGDPSDSVFVILAGQVDIMAETDHGPICVGNRLQGDIVGEMGVIRNAPRSTSVVAGHNTQVLRIEADIFLETLASNPAAAIEIMRQLANKLAESNDNVVRLERALSNHSANPQSSAEP